MTANSKQLIATLCPFEVICKLQDHCLLVMLQMQSLKNTSKKVFINRDLSVDKNYHMSTWWSYFGETREREHDRCDKVWQSPHFTALYHNSSHSVALHHAQHALSHSTICYASSCFVVLNACSVAQPNGVGRSVCSALLSFNKINPSEPLRNWKIRKIDESPWSHGNSQIQLDSFFLHLHVTFHTFSLCLESFSWEA